MLTRRIVLCTLAGGLTVGTLDGLDAIVFFGSRGAIPHRIFQRIASGLIGPRAMDVSGKSSPLIRSTFQRSRNWCC